MFVFFFFFTKVKGFGGGRGEIKTTSKKILKITTQSVDIKKGSMENIFQAGPNYVLAATWPLFLSFLFQTGVPLIAQNYIRELSAYM